MFSIQFPLTGVLWVQDEVWVYPSGEHRVRVSSVECSQSPEGQALGVRHMGCWVLGPGGFSFHCVVLCMGICWHLGPRVQLCARFTSDGLTLVGFNSIILLFVFNLSYVFSSYIPPFSFWVIWDRVVFFLIPFYCLCQFIRFFFFLRSCFKIHDMCHNLS